MKKSNAAIGKMDMFGMNSSGARQNLGTMAGVMLLAFSVTVSAPVWASQRDPLLKSTPAARLNKGTATGVEVAAIALTQSDPASCTYNWFATIRNRGSVDTDDGGVVQAQQGDDNGEWTGASGVSLPLVRPGETKTSHPITFVRRGEKTKFKVELYWNGRVWTQKTINLPAEHLRVQLTDYRVTATTFQVSVKNLSAKGYPGLFIQTFSAPDAAGPWSAAGGFTIFSVAGGGRPSTACLTGSSKYVHNGRKPADHPYVKIQLKHSSNNTVLEKVFEPPKRGRGRRDRRPERVQTRGSSM